MPNEKLVPQKPLHEVLCAIQGALGEDNQKVFARASREMGRSWAKKIPKARDIDELMERARSYLQDELRLGSVGLERSGGEHILRVRGCHLCHSDLVRERHGIRPACGVSQFPVGAAMENLGVGSARLKEIRKPGPPGECDLVYEFGE